jgi:hypothetical protein
MSHEQRAAECFDRAIAAYERGTLETAVQLMRDSAVQYALADAETTEVSVERVLARAVACRMSGDYLFEAEEFAQAANLYQEAVDQYARLAGEEAEAAVRKCAALVLECIDQLRSRPYERLHLLIAQYELRQRQYEALGGHEKQQGECAAHIARILQRRERYEESVVRYREALELFSSCDADPDAMMAAAECHHRMASMLEYRLFDSHGAIEHLNCAIELYGQFEPYLYGRQQAKSQCVRILREILARRS